MQVKEFLQERNPFEYGPVLCNIVDGVHASSSVNADSALSLGKNIVSRMIGSNPKDFTFKRKDQAVTLASKSAVKLDGESVQVDPQLLFQRLTLAGKSNLEDTLKFELCTYPPVLFESQDLLNESQKANFADALWHLTRNKDEVIPKTVHYVVDGGALVHCVPWTNQATFADILRPIPAMLQRSMEMQLKFSMVTEDHQQKT